MKRIVYVILLISFPITMLASGFVIQGTIAGLSSGLVSVSYHNTSGDDTSITAQVINGQFNLAGKVAEPELVRLTISEGWSYNASFFLENSAITMSMVKDAGEQTAISGSASELAYEKLKPGLNEFFAHARDSKAAHEQAATMNDSHAVATADSIWARQQAGWIETLKASIAANRDNYAALYFIQWLLFKPDHMDLIKTTYMQLSPKVRDGIAGRKFLSEFDHLNRAAPGSMAPEIVGRDTLGKVQTLAAHRGKVVLLDFWSSYCGPCRQENRRMLTVYPRYHAQGFEIMSFSMDNDRSMWLAAIRADGMPWPQASDLRGGAGATPGSYDIIDLPRNVLIDRSGKIYARDLHGDDLIRAVEMLLKK